MMEREAVAKMAASADGQTKYGQSVKGLLTEKVSTCGADVIALTKQVLKGSRSSELLGHAARNMVMQEDAILHSEDSLRKMAIITTHLQYQQEAIQKKCPAAKVKRLRTWKRTLHGPRIAGRGHAKSVEQSSNLQDQLKHLLK